MIKLTDILYKKIHHGLQQHDVALVLGGGGARGWAHIGAIESLEDHGYHITSVAGTSMGALVGGVYAAGAMAKLKALALDLNRKKMLQIIDLSPGLDHIASGQRVTEMLHELIGEVSIEQLPIKFCCSASEMTYGKEHVFNSGPLVQAIRSSISIPGFFAPVCEGKRIYVDGSIHNTLPLDRVARKPGDLLVAMNVSAPETTPFQSFLAKYDEPKNVTERSIWHKIPFLHTDFSANYMNMMLRVAKISVQNNTMMALRITPPDIYAQMPMGRYSLFDFDKARQIISYGRQKMDQALDSYEKSQEKRLRR